MITAWTESEDFRLAKEFFDREFDRYTITRTASSSIFQVNKFKAIVSEHRLSLRALGLINRVRKEAREFLERVGPIDETFRPRLFSFDRIRTVEQGFEYDKKQAYPRTALALGVITKQCFESLLKLKKRERLIVLGSLATKRTIFRVERGKIIEEPKIEEEETAPIWRMIVSRVDEEMREKAKRLDADFYWVDALFTAQQWKAHCEEWKERRVGWVYDQRGKFILFSDGRRFYIASYASPRSTLNTRSA
jgi:hypothetical protein